MNRSTPPRLQITRRRYLELPPGQTLAKVFLQPEVLAEVPDKCPEYSGSKIPRRHATWGFSPSGVDLQGQTGREPEETVECRLPALAPSLTLPSAPSSRHSTGNSEALPLPNRRINSRTHVFLLSCRVPLFIAPACALREPPTMLKHLLALACQQSDPARNQGIDLEPTDSIRQTAPHGRNAHVHPQASRVGQPDSLDTLDRHQLIAHLLWNRGLVSAGRVVRAATLIVPFRCLPLAHAISPFTDSIVSRASRCPMRWLPHR